MSLTRYDDVLQSVTALDDLRIIPDSVSARGRGIYGDDPGIDCISLNKMKFTEAGGVHVPGYGLLRMTGWARRQLGNEIGVRWDKFFGEQDPDKINRAVQDHLRARGVSPIKKMIARNHVSSKETGTDGLLRGLVSTTYSEVRDARLFDRMRIIIGSKQLKNMGFAKWDLRDNGSHYSLVHNETIDLTGRNLKPGGFEGLSGPHGAPQKDIGYYGLRLRNSEVGAYSYTADAYIMRLVCINGLMVMVEGERIMKRKHIGLGDDEKLDEMIDNTFKALPKVREKIVATNKILSGVRIPDPEAEIRNFLARNKQPKIIQDNAVKAYMDEPVDNALGIVQAITRLGMAMRNIPDRQHEIELLAGTYIDKAVKAA